MALLRSGKALKEGNEKAAKISKAQRLPASKKRKAQEAPPEEENKEKVRPRLTPPPAESKALAEAKQNEKTPGRVGPIKRTSFSASPDIKPFKGPPGKKVRKTWLHVCFDKCPNGSPTYDKAGFQLDYDKVAQWMKPTAYNKGAMIKGMERSVEKSCRETERMAEIFFEKGEGPENPKYAEGADHWKDRVSKDLNIPWHKIGVGHFEEWEKRGFKKARKGDYERFSEDEDKRMLNMLDGASLRK